MYEEVVWLTFRRTKRGLVSQRVSDSGWTSTWRALVPVRNHACADIFATFRGTDVVQWPGFLGMIAGTKVRTYVYSMSEAPALLLTTWDEACRMMIEDGTFDGESRGWTKEPAGYTVELKDGGRWERWTSSLLVSCGIMSRNCFPSEAFLHFAIYSILCCAGHILHVRQQSHDMRVGRLSIQVYASADLVRSHSDTQEHWDNHH